MSSLLQVGDVGRSRTVYGQLSTSLRDSCPSCRKFVKRGAESCSRCGASFVPITDGVAQVIGYAR